CFVAQCVTLFAKKISIGSLISKISINLLISSVLKISSLILLLSVLGVIPSSLAISCCVYPFSTNNPFSLLIFKKPPPKIICYSLCNFIIPLFLLLVKQFILYFNKYLLL